MRRGLKPRSHVRGAGPSKEGLPSLIGTTVPPNVLATTETISFHSSEGSASLFVCLRFFPFLLFFLIRVFPPKSSVSQTSEALLRGLQLFGLQFISSPPAYLRNRLPHIAASAFSVARVNHCVCFGFLRTSIPLWHTSVAAMITGYLFLRFISSMLRVSVQSTSYG